MKRKKLTAILMTAALAGVIVFGCGSNSADEENTKNTSADAQDEEKEESVELLIAAAASLEYSYEDELIPMFEEENPGITVKGTYDSSGKLQTQIEEGIEADVFMSAATKQMNALVEESLVDKDSVVNLLENKIVLITSVDSGLELRDFTDITKAETIAI